MLFSEEPILDKNYRLNYYKRCYYMNAKIL